MWANWIQDFGKYSIIEGWFEWKKRISTTKNKDLEKSDFLYYNIFSFCILLLKLNVTKLGIFMKIERQLPKKSIDRKNVSKIKLNIVEIEFERKTLKIEFFLFSLGFVPFFNPTVNMKNSRNLFTEWQF
jgi:hypothetical protein